MIVNVHEAKTHLSRLLVEVQNHQQRIRICRNGQPVAEIVPIAAPNDPLIQCPALQTGAINDDVTAPLGEDDWPEEFR